MQGRTEKRPDHTPAHGSTHLRTPLLPLRCTPELGSAALVAAALTLSQLMGEGMRGA